MSIVRIETQLRSEVSCFTSGKESHSYIFIFSLVSESFIFATLGSQSGSCGLVMRVATCAFGHTEGG